MTCLLIMTSAGCTTILSSRRFRRDSETLNTRCPEQHKSFRRDLPDEQKSELPPWWPRDPDLLIIDVTLGTVFPLESGDLFERILPGLGPLQAGVVTTVGPDLDPAALGPQPDHVHV